MLMMSPNNKVQLAVRVPTIIAARSVHVLAATAAAVQPAPILAAS
jgi:hypothetical protein